MTIYVSVESNTGEITRLRERPCFGFMRYINRWKSTFRTSNNNPNDHGWGDDTPIPSFEAGNIKAVRWHWRRDSDAFNQAYQLLEEIDEVLDNPMFKHISRSRSILVGTVMGLQMDETVVPLIMLRNAAYGSYDAFREEGFSPFQSVIMCNLLYLSKRMGSKEYVPYMQHGDSTVFNPYYISPDMVVALLLGKAGLHFWQERWGENGNDAGYHSGGEFNDFASVDHALPRVYPKILDRFSTDIILNDHEEAHPDLKACTFQPDMWVDGVEVFADTFEHHMEADTTAHVTKLYKQICEQVIGND